MNFFKSYIYELSKVFVLIGTVCNELEQNNQG